MALPSGIIGHEDLSTDFVAVDTQSDSGRYTRVLKNRTDTPTVLFSYPTAGWIEDTSVLDISLVTTGVAYNALNGKAPTSHGHSTEDISSFGDWAVTSDADNNIAFKILDIENWTAVTDSTFGTSHINSICYGNGKFVAVGFGGKIAYSSDGINWTAASSPVDVTLVDVCYGNGKFVAVGNRKILYSMDATTWTLIPDSGSDYNFAGSVCYGNGKFVAGGTSGKMAYSLDGISWTAVTDSKFNYTSHIYGVHYGNGKFIASGGYGGMVCSANGVTWTAVTDSKFGSSYINNTCYGNGKFVAVGEGGKIAYSSDGISWTAVTDSKFGSSYINNICYGNGKFVAVGASGKMAYSSDGISWTLVSDSGFGDLNIGGACYGNGKFVAVGRGGKMFYCR